MGEIFLFLYPILVPPLTVYLLLRLSKNNSLVFNICIQGVFLIANIILLIPVATKIMYTISPKVGLEGISEIFILEIIMVTSYLLSISALIYNKIKKSKKNKR